ncbi:uncharacterized protein G2W53_033316 [Senna tora]|uniref:Retrotransposon gag domain-containing protein n=1 Tax=Senna tora TaxID=362788 RepID=A0A834T0D5_9FABA|nr:uncharacterized protein G2W53_033316 [Senna tora]
MLGRRSLSFDLKSYDPEIERTPRLLRAHKQEEMAGDPLRPLKEYFTPSKYDSPSSTRLPEIGANQFEIKPSIIQMLPSFYGLSSENPYKHIDEFLEVCSTFKLPNVSEDAIRLRLFPFSLKDKAKHWLTTRDNIATWDQMSKEFLKKYFPAGKLTKLRQEITNFSQLDNELFHETWERFRDLLRSCPHHEVPKWQLVNSFYSGLSERNQQMIDSSCGGIFLDKNPDEAWDLFEHLSENSQQRATSSRIGTSRQVANKGGIYEVSNNHDLSNQVASLSKKFDQLMNKLPVNFSNSQDVCVICASPKHCATDCPSASSYPEYMEQHVNATQGFKQDNPYSNTYNPGWRNHPNFSWRQQNSDPQRQQVNPNGLVNPSTYQSPRYGQPSPQSFQSSGIDHNFQNQVLSALKNLDPMRQLLDSHTQSIAKLETQVGQLANTIARRDEGKLPSFPMENPRGQTYQEETKAVTTLRSGKIIDNKDRSNGCFGAKYEG